MEGNVVPLNRAELDADILLAIREQISKLKHPGAKELLSEDLKKATVMVFSEMVLSRQ